MHLHKVEHLAVPPPGTLVAHVGINKDRWLGESQEPHHVDIIFVLCVFIYCLITILWATYWLVTRTAPSSSRWLYMPLVGISWGMTSIAMHVLNKAVVERTQAPATIASVQMAIAVAIILPLSSYDLLQVKPRQLMIWLIVPLIFGGAVCMSSFTYKYISLSLYAIVRNLAPLLVMPMEGLLMGREKAPTITPMVCMALVANVAGAFLYVESLHGLAWTGIIFAVVNMLLAVLDRFVQRRLLTTECKDIPTKVCTLINNAVGILPSLIVCLASHELATARENHLAWTHAHNIFLILGSGVAGLAICYLGFECQRMVSVTSFYVMQNVSRVFLIVVGVVLFGDPLHGCAPILGLVLSLCGSGLYGHIQMRSQASGLPDAKLGGKHREKHQQLDGTDNTAKLADGEADEKPGGAAEDGSPPVGSQRERQPRGAADEATPPAGDQPRLRN